MPLHYEDLTPAQRKAVDAWRQKEDADNTYEFQDNHRYATKGDADQEWEYEDSVSRGCCGSVNVELPCDDGSVLLYGFNYGH